MTIDVEVLDESVKHVFSLCPPLNHKKIYDLDTMKERVLLPSDDFLLYSNLKTIIKREYKLRIAEKYANVSIFE